MPSLLFTIPTGTDRRTCNRCSKLNIGGLNFSCLFERAEIQIPVNKYECPQRLSFSPGNLFWGSFTNHNTGNYLREGINITTNQRLSPTFRGKGNTIIVGDSQTSPPPIFPEGGGTSVHRLSLRSRRLNGSSGRKKERERERETRVSPSRAPVLFCAHYFHSSACYAG